MLDDLHSVSTSEFSSRVDLGGDINKVLETVPQVVKVEELKEFVNTRFDGKTIGIERWDIKKGRELAQLGREVVSDLQIVKHGEMYGWNGRTQGGNLVGIIDATQIEMFADNNQPDWMILRWVSQGSGNSHIRRYWSPKMDLDAGAGVDFNY